MKTAPSPSAGKPASLAHRVARRRVAFIVVSAVAAALICVALVTAQSPAIPVVATVRHAPTLNGRVEGSVQMLTGEYLTLNSNGVVKGDLLVPGTPTVMRNGTPVYQGAIDGSGSAQPSNYSVTLNSGSEVRYVRRRTDPGSLAPVPVPPAPAGTRYVSINSPGQSVGTWATVRNLTLNSNVGPYAVLAGTYGSFTANSGSSFVLGTAGATQAAVYNFEEITLNSLANLNVVGPVVINVANRVTVNSSCIAGSAQNPRWLSLNVSRYDVTINGGQVYGVLRAPAGSVNLSGGTLRGEVFSDRLTVNGGTIVGVPSDITPPSVSIAQPAAGSVTNAASITVAGTFNDESATTVKINGVSATVSGNSFDAVVPLVEGSNTLQVVATDAAGNEGTASRQVSRDSTPPTLSIQQPAAGLYTSAAQVTVSGAYGDQSVTVVTVNGVAATLQGSGYSAVVPLTEGGNELVVAALDAAGNRAELRRQVVRDSAPPTLTVAQPDDGAVTGDEQVTVSGAFADSSPITVTVNGVTAALTDATYSAVVPLAEGQNTFQIAAVDEAGNRALLTRAVTRDTARPTLTLTRPADGTVAKLVTVEGSVADSTAAGVQVNGMPVPVAGDGTFRTEYRADDGTQLLTVTATDAAGNLTELTRTVVVDNTGPVITALAPEEGSTVGVAADVSGQVSDLTAVSVQVNGVSAEVATGGVFTAHNVAVSEGDNVIRVAATDAAGNQSAAELRLVGRDRTPPPPPDLFPIISPTRLNFQTISGRAEPGSRVTILGGSEPVVVESAFGTGLFMTTLSLAPGDNLFSATTADAEGNVSPATQFSVTSDPTMAQPPDGQPAQINVSTGNSQKGLAGGELPRPLIAIVTDRSGRPVANTSVTFTVQQGGGHFAGGGLSAEATTDEQGHASARYVCGAEPGPQMVRADFAGNTVTPVAFLAESLKASDGGITSVSGVVLDQNMRALPQALIRIGGQQTRTDAEGRFVVANVAVGPHQLLEVIGRDQIPLPGRWPNISYDMDVLPGIDNHMGRPLFLPRVNEGVALPLDSQSVVTRDTVFELPVVGGEPPVKVTARAGTRVTFPPDVTDKRLSVTRIATNRIPMALEDGRATNLYISVQPSGAIFDPPLEISFPNVDRLDPNTEVLLMSFDHDAGRYVKVGTGRVSADGRAVTGDPGSGIRVGAWHALPPDPPQYEGSVTGHIKIKGNPAFEDKVILKSEAWADGVRAVLLTAPKSLSSADRLDYLVNLTWPRNTPKQVTVDTTNKVVSAKAKITELTFSGDTYKAVVEDKGGAYGTPHWKDANDNGKASDPGDSRFPVAYVRDSFIKASAKFKLEEAIPPTELKVYGYSSEGIEFETTINASGQTFEITNVQAKAKLPNTVKFYNPLKITWSVSFDGGDSARKIGVTDNRVYVTLAAPTAPVLYESLLDIGCRNADDKTTDADVVSAIWTNDFAGPTPGVKRKKTDGHNVDDGKEMRYWGTDGSPEAIAAGQFCQTFHEMLNPTPSDPALNGIGTCAAWSQLLHQTIKAQGIAGTEIHELKVNPAIIPAPPAPPSPPGAPSAPPLLVEFMVKNWKFGKYLRTGSNGINNSAPVGDDYAIIPQGNGLPNVIAIGPGANGILETTPGGDDQVVDVNVGGTTLQAINTGANGICNTDRAGDDNQVAYNGQVINKNKGLPNVEAITPGPNGVLDSARLGDDEFAEGLWSARNPAFPYVVWFPTVPLGDVANQPGVPGQGVAEPPPLFENHFILKYGGKYYDPSYGAGPFESSLQHEKASIDGFFAVTFADGIGSVPVGRKNSAVTTTAELIYARKPGLE